MKRIITLRVLASMALVVGVYSETGIWTASSVFAIFACMELIHWSLKKEVK